MISFFSAATVAAAATAAAAAAASDVASDAATATATANLIFIARCSAKLLKYVWAPFF